MHYSGYPQQMPTAGLHGHVRTSGARAGAAPALAGAAVHAGRRGAAPRVRAQHHRRHQG